MIGWLDVAVALENEVGYSKVHVGNRTANITTSVFFPFRAVGAATINQLVKVAHAQGQPFADTAIIVLKAWR